MEGLDAIILPGSKNVMTDVLWLHQNGIAARIRKAAEAGIKKSRGQNQNSISD